MMRFIAGIALGLVLGSFLLWQLAGLPGVPLSPWSGKSPFPPFSAATSPQENAPGDLAAADRPRMSPPAPRAALKPINIANLPHFRQMETLIQKYARVHGVDEDLVWAVIRMESGFNPRAVSPKGAMGLMQLMPGTAALLGVANPFDVEENIAGGIRYLERCLSQFNQDVGLALAAYNAGPENVVKYRGCPPFAETRHYVAAILQHLAGPPHRRLFTFTGLPAEEELFRLPLPLDTGLAWMVPAPKWQVPTPRWKIPPPGKPGPINSSVGKWPSARNPAAQKEPGRTGGVSHPPSARRQVSL